MSRVLPVPAPAVDAAPDAICDCRLFCNRDGDCDGDGDDLVGNSDGNARGSDGELPPQVSLGLASSFRYDAYLGCVAPERFEQSFDSS